MKKASIDFLEIIKKSYSYILRYKYLWFLGLLAGGSVGMGNSGYTMSGSDIHNRKDLEYLKNSGSDSFRNIESISGKISGISPTIWLILAISVLILIILMIYLSVTARGAIIYSVDKIDSGEDINLSQSWQGGKKYFWRILFLSIIFGLAVLVLFLVLAGVIATLVYFNLTITAIILGLLFLLVYIVFIIYLSLVIPYSERILILEDISSVESVARGIKFFNRNWRNAVLMYLIIVALNIGASIALAIGLGTIIILLVLIGLLFYAINMTLVWIYGILAGLVVLALLLIASGIIQSFNSTAFTLTYREIKKLE